MDSPPRCGPRHEWRGVTRTYLLRIGGKAEVGIRAVSKSATKRTWTFCLPAPAMIPRTNVTTAIRTDWKKKVRLKSPCADKSRWVRETGTGISFVQFNASHRAGIRPPTHRPDELFYHPAKNSSSIPSPPIVIAPGAFVTTRKMERSGSFRPKPSWNGGWGLAAAIASRIW